MRAQRLHLRDSAGPKVRGQDGDGAILTHGQQPDDAGAAAFAVEAELATPVAVVQLVALQLLRPVDDVMRENSGYRLDLSLTPRTPNARISYRDRWSPHRFERLGRLFMTPPGHVLHTRSDMGDQRSIVCQLLPHALRAWFDSDGGGWSDRRLEESVDIGSATVRGLLVRLGEEARRPGFASAALGEALAVQLAIELGRHFMALGDLPHSGGIAPWRLRLIDDRLHGVRAAPTLAELAGLCDLSVRQLTRGFRASRGCSIGDHIAAVRIETAKELLADGGSIKAVAGTMGFATPSGFCYAFRKATGLPPRQYRDGIAKRGH